MKKQYKRLRKHLKNRFVNSTGKEYEITGAIREWARQSGVKPCDKVVRILVEINDNKVFYPYQKKDRKKILKYLKENKTYVRIQSRRA